MKTLAVMLVLAGCLIWVPLTGARDANREVTDREWQSVNRKPLSMTIVSPRSVHTEQTQAHLGPLPKNYEVKKVR